MSSRPSGSRRALVRCGATQVSGAAEARSPSTREVQQCRAHKHASQPPFPPSSHFYFAHHIAAFSLSPTNHKPSAIVNVYHHRHSIAFQHYRRFRYPRPVINMRYSIVASAFGLFSVAVAEATVTITQVSTVFPSNCEASECEPDPSASDSTPNALTVLEMASTQTFPSTINALSVLLSALTVENPTSYPASAFPSFPTPGSVSAGSSQLTSTSPSSPTSGSVSTESSQFTSTGPTGATNPPGYGESTTVTVESTSVVQSTATVQTSGSTEVSPAGTSGTGVPTAPGPVTSETASTTEGAPAPSTTPGSTESGPESTTLATSASESASNTGSQSSTAPSAAASTNAPPAATGAADMKKPSVVGLAAIMAALVYL
ncbi:unnamed protein product [Cercospora beticola]|nr:unnamed protein product [Cercospora beticola]